MLWTTLLGLVGFGFMAYQPLYVIQWKTLFIHIYTYIWFGLAWFYGISTYVGYLMPNLLYTYISNIYDLVWFSFMAYQPLWVIQCRILFIHIYQIYKIWFSWILWHINQCRLFNAKSSSYIYIKYIWFGLVEFLWHINHCRLFHTKSSLYIRHIWFGLVGLYGISTVVGYLIPNLLYTYTLNVNDL